MNSSPMYATTLNQVFNSQSGITVKRQEVGGDWVEQSWIGDTGPIAWKETAVDVEIEPSDSLARARVRLEFFPDNVAIDLRWVGTGR